MAEERGKQVMACHFGPRPFASYIVRLPTHPFHGLRPYTMCRLQYVWTSGFFRSLRTPARNTWVSLLDHPSTRVKSASE